MEKHLKKFRPGANARGLDSERPAPEAPRPPSRVSPVPEWVDAPVRLSGRSILRHPPLANGGTTPGVLYPQGGVRQNHLRCVFALANESCIR
jgi:hypothetical protein